MKNKIVNICVFFIILISIGTVIIIRPLGDLDEIWNYNFANNVFQNKIPYRDFNMVPTPLLPIVCSIFMRIFSNELIVMRILAILLSTGILFTSYKLLDLLKINKNLNYITIIILFYLLKDLFTIDYNFAVLFLVLIIMYIEIKQYKKENILLKLECKKDVLLGILAGLCITLKQSTGLIVAVTLIGYKILEIRNKKDFKEFIKIALMRTIGMLIPVIIMVIYLVYNNALNSFIDYAILGMKTFENKVEYITLLLKQRNILVQILSVLSPMIIIFSLIYGMYKKEKKLLIIGVYSLSSFVVTFPISDRIHFLIGAMPSILGLAYIVNLLLEKIIKSDNIKIFSKYFFKSVIFIIVIYFGITMVPKMQEYFKSNNSNINHFSYIKIESGLCTRINEIDKFILEQDVPVYILDAEAAVYNIPINKYYKNYDLLLKGNLGRDGEEGIIKTIQEELNTNERIFLIKNEKYLQNWQTPLKVINYVKNNLSKVNEISIYDVYINKN